MRNTKLLEILEAMSTHELDQMGKVVRSPYFNEGSNQKEIIALFEQVREALENRETEKLERESVYQKVFPDSPYVQGKLDKLMSRLLKISKRFLAFQYSEVEAQESRQLLALSKFYRERNMGKRFRANILQLRKKQTSFQQDQEYFWNQFYIEQEVNHFDSLNNYRKSDINLKATMESLDLAYVVTKLEISCGLLLQNIDIALNVRQSLLWPDEIERILQKSPELQVPIVMVYYQALLMLRNIDEKNEEPFQKFKTLLHAHSDKIPIDKLQSLQAIARNYCVARYNEGQSKFLEEAFSLYQEHLSEGYLYYDGALMSNTIINIVQLGLRLKRYDWIKSFLLKHKNRISGTQYPLEVFHLNLAIYYFHIREFDHALEHLIGNYEDTYYTIAAKRLEIKIYYEEQSVLLEPKMDAFKVFIFRLSRKLLSEVQKKANNNFINLLIQINHPKTKGNPGRIAKLKEKVMHTSSISDRSWLLEKLEEEAKV